MPDLAVIMSVYQNDKLEYLELSVQSILNQSYTKFDFYIVIDGPVSSELDRYLSIAKDKDKRIKLYKFEKNGGLAKALNFILEITLENPEYRLIARMDADDISMLTRFEKQYNFLTENANIFVVGSWYQEIDEFGKLLSVQRLPVEHEALKKRFYSRTPFAHPSVMYRKNLVETAGYYPTDTILMEDTVLWGNALKAGLRIANLPEYLLKFRIDKNFYKRRSGIKYGWSYIKTRFKINKLLCFPMYINCVSILIGVLKMIPSSILRYVYLGGNVFKNLKLDEI